MGWKNLKEHFRISHIVWVNDDGVICIGSGFVPTIILVKPDGSLDIGSSLKVEGCRDDLGRYWKEMSADQSTVVRLIAAPDSFTAAIPVYTYKGGVLLEKFCEVLGWPNVTHDGALMYGNTFSPDKMKVVRWAKRNTQLAIENESDAIADLENRLDRRRQYLAARILDREQLDRDYPE